MVGEYCHAACLPIRCNKRHVGRSPALVRKSLNALSCQLLLRRIVVLQGRTQVAGRVLQSLTSQRRSWTTVAFPLWQWRHQRAARSHSPQPMQIVFCPKRTVR